MHLNQEIKYRYDIDSLRGIAVLVVCLFHFWPQYITGGYIGVDIFFVISGFLITSIITKKLESDTFSFADFYIRRVRRLFPALLAILLLTLLVGFYLFLYDDFVDLIKHTLYALIFSSNLMLWRDVNYFNSTAELKTLLHLWSLGIEEQFYLVWPLIIVLLRKFNLNLNGFAYFFLIASFLLNIYVTRHSQTAAFYLPLTRYWEFLLGAIVSIHWKKHSNLLSQKRLSIFFYLGLGLIFYSCLIFDKNTIFPGFNAFIPAIGASLVILFGDGTKFYKYSRLETVLRFFGRISYSLYLVHWPLIAINNLAIGVPYTPAYYLFAASIAISYLMTVLVEKPFLTKYATFSGFRILMFTYIALLGFIGYFFVLSPVKKNSREADKINASYLPFLEFYSTYSDRVDAEFSEGCNFRNKDQSSKETICDSCFTVKDLKKPTILLWGDSHMQALSYGIRNKLQSKYNILQIATHSSAPTLNLRLDQTSVKANEFALELIRKISPEIVILAQNNEHLRNDWEMLIRKIESYGVKHVMLVGPVPKWFPSLPRVLIKTGSTESKFMNVNIGLDKEVAKDDKELLELSKSIGFEYLSVYNFLRQDDSIRVRVPNSNELVVFDYGHLTLPASKLIADQLIAPRINNLHK